MPNPLDREDTEYLAQKMGEALEEISIITKGIKNYVKNITIGERPGQYGFPVDRRVRIGASISINGGEPRPLT